jgi:hypothetical protein
MDTETQVTQELRDTVRAIGLDEFIVDTNEAASILGIEPSALHMRQHRGSMPTTAIQSRGCVYYWRQDIEAMAS